MDRPIDRSRRWYIRFWREGGQSRSFGPVWLSRCPRVLYLDRGVRGVPEDERTRAGHPDGAWQKISGRDALGGNLGRRVANSQSLSEFTDVGRVRAGSVSMGHRIGSRQTAGGPLVGARRGFRRTLFCRPSRIVSERDRPHGRLRSGSPGLGLALVRRRTALPQGTLVGSLEKPHGGLGTGHAKSRRILVSRFPEISPTSHVN